MSFSRKRTQKCARVRACAEGRLVENGEARGRDFFFPFFFMGKAAGGVWRVEVGMEFFFQQKMSEGRERRETDRL